MRGIRKSTENLFIYCSLIEKKILFHIINPILFESAIIFLLHVFFPFQILELISNRVPPEDLSQCHACVTEIQNTGVEPCCDQKSYSS